jgi:hypothetical protein
MDGGKMTPELSTLPFFPLEGHSAAALALYLGNPLPFQ